MKSNEEAALAILLCSRSAKDLRKFARTLGIPTSGTKFKIATEIIRKSRGFALSTTLVPKGDINIGVQLTF